MKFNVLTHFTGIENHHAALCKLVDAWHDVFAVPLLFFSNKGPGQPATVEFLAERSVFGRLDDSIGLRLRESRRKDAADLDIYFTNPARAFYGDLNYVSATLPWRLIEEKSWSSLSRQVTKFMETIFPIGEVTDSEFNHEDIALNSPGEDVFRAFKVEYDCAVGHIFFLPDTVAAKWGGRKALRSAGFVIHSVLQTGLIVGLPFDLDAPVQESAWHLFQVLEDLKLLGSDGNDAVLDEHIISIQTAGTFLRAFEARYGRVFGCRYSSGGFKIVNPS